MISSGLEGQGPPKFKKDAGKREREELEELGEEQEQGQEAELEEERLQEGGSLGGENEEQVGVEEEFKYLTEEESSHVAFEPSQGKVELSSEEDVEFKILCHLAEGTTSSIALGEIKRQSDHQKGQTIRLRLNSTAFLQDSKFVALKSIKRVKKDGHYVTPKAAVHEVEIFQRACRDECKFIVRYGFHCVSESLLYIGMEYCSGGDLFALLSSVELQGSDVLFYATEIMLGLRHLHENFIIHGDLKPENIALAVDGHTRLIDFGLSALLQPEQLCEHSPGCGRGIVTESGTLPYCAPEILRRQRHAFETDWWSFGVVLFELLFGCLPWYTDDEQETCIMICTSAPVPPTENVEDPLCYDLISRLLEKEPSARLGYNAGFGDIVAHSFFDNVDWAIAQAQGYKPPFILEEQ